MSDEANPTMLRVEALDAEAARLESALQEVRKQREIALAGLPDIYKEIAEALHVAECRWDHTDGCGWGYETSWDSKPKDERPRGTWEGGAHGRWLEIARKRILDSGAPPEDFLVAVRLVKAVRGE